MVVEQEGVATKQCNSGGGARGGATKQCNSGGGTRGGGLQSDVRVIQL